MHGISVHVVVDWFKTALFEEAYEYGSDMVLIVSLRAARGGLSPRSPAPSLL